MAKVKTCVIGKNCGKACIRKTYTCNGKSEWDGVPVCIKGKVCGKSCIQKKRACHKDPVEPGCAHVNEPEPVAEHPNIAQLIREKRARWVVRGDYEQTPAPDIGYDLGGACAASARATELLNRLRR